MILKIIGVIDVIICLIFAIYGFGNGFIMEGISFLFLCFNGVLIFIVGWSFDKIRELNDKTKKMSYNIDAITKYLHEKEAWENRNQAKD